MSVAQTLIGSHKRYTTHAHTHTHTTRSCLTLSTLLFPISFNWLCLPPCVGPPPPSPLALPDSSCLQIAVVTSSAVSVRGEEAAVAGSYVGKLIVWGGGWKVTRQAEQLVVSGGCQDAWPPPALDMTERMAECQLNCSACHVCHARRYRKSCFLSGRGTVEALFIFYL